MEEENNVNNVETTSDSNNATDAGNNNTGENNNNEVNNDNPRENNDNPGENNNGEEDDTQRIINPDGAEIEICDNPLEDSRYVDALEYIKDKKYEEAIDLLSDVLEDCQELIEKSDSNCGYVNYYYSYCLTKVIYAKLLQIEKPENKTNEEEEENLEQVFSDIESAWECAELARVLLEKDNSPLLPEVFILLGDLGRIQGNTKQALDDYMRAKDMCEDKTVAYCNIGECFSDLFENIKFGTKKRAFKRNVQETKEGDNESSSTDESGEEEKIEEEAPKTTNEDSNKPDEIKPSDSIDLTKEEDANYYKDEAIKYYNCALNLCNEKLTKFCTENSIDCEGDTEFKKLYGKFDNKDLSPEEDKLVEILLYRSVLVDKLKFLNEPFQKQDKFDEPTIKGVEPQPIEVRKRKKDSSKDGEPSKIQKTE